MIVLRKYLNQLLAFSMRQVSAKKKKNAFISVRNLQPQFSSACAAQTNANYTFSSLFTYAYISIFSFALALGYKLIEYL